MRFIIFSVLLLHVVAFGVEIEEIIKNHPEIKAIDRELKSLRQKEIYQLSLPDPIFSIAVKDVQLFYRPFDRNLEPMQSIELKLLQSYPLYSKREKKSQIVKSKYRSRYYALLEKKQELMFQLYQAAYRMWEVEEKLKIVKEYKKVAQDLISLTTTLYSVGKASQSEVFDAQFFLTQLQRKEIILRNRLKKIKSRIRYFSDRKVKISPEKPEKITELKTLIDTALKNNPAIQRRFQLVKLQKEKVSLAKLEYRPDFAFFGAYSYRKGYRDYISVGLSFNLPVWKKNKQDRAVLQNVLLKEKEENQLKAVVREIKTQLEESYYDALSSYESYQLLKDIMSQISHSVYESILSEYQVGRKNIFDVLKAINQILTVKNKIIEETASYNIAVKKIEKLTGEIK